MTSIDATRGTDWNWFMSFVQAGGPEAATRLKKWDDARTGPQWEEVKTFLRGLRHDLLHELELDAVCAACGTDGHEWKGRHVLGVLRPEHAKFERINDFSTPFALEYLFHGCLEEKGRLPGWNDVISYIFSERRSWYIDPFYAFYGLVPGAPETKPGSAHMSALQWRVGNAYYSWLREVHLLTALRRRHGLDVRYHALADAEFKADLVHDDAVVALYVRNDRYRNGARGRKVTATAANPNRRVVEMPIDLRRDFGRPWMITDESIAAVAAQLGAAARPIAA